MFNVNNYVVEKVSGTYGKRESSTLCPVSRGWLAGSFSVTGRGWRTGHTCNMVYFSFSPSNSVSNTTSCTHKAHVHFSNYTQTHIGIL